MLHLPAQRRFAHQSQTTRAVVVGIGYFLLAEVSSYLAMQGLGFATFWPAAGLLLAALLTSARREWPVLLVVSLLASVASDVTFHQQPLWVGLSFWFGTALEVTAVALCIQWWLRGRIQIDNASMMLRLVATAAIGSFLGATIGMLVITNIDPAVSPIIAMRICWGANVLGMVVCAPLFLSHANPRGRKRSATWTISRAVEAGFLTGLLLAVANLVFAEAIELSPWPHRFRFPAMVFPVLIWVALRFHVRGVVLANVTVAVIATYYASRGMGPFVRSDFAFHHAISLQAFLAVSMLVSLSLAAGVAQARLAEQQQRRLAGRLRAERQRLQQHSSLLQSILNSIGDGVMVQDAHGAWLQFNPAARRLCGLGPNENPPAQLADAMQVLAADGVTPIAPANLPSHRALHGEIVEPSQQLVLKTKGKEPSVVTCTARPLNDSAGKLQAGVVVIHDVTAEAHAAAERELFIGELERALSEIKTLRGLIPICANCKSIRDDDGYWQRLEGFLMRHTEAQFTHGICNDCGEKLYGQLWRDSVVHGAHNTPSPKAETQCKSPTHKA